MAKQWENVTVSFTGDLVVEALNDLGKNGWEPYAVSKGVVYFKRPIENAEETKHEQKYSSVPNNPFDELRDILQQTWGEWKVKLNLS